MSSKNKKNQYSYAKDLKSQTSSVEKGSLIFWLLSTIVVIFLFWAPFQKGLFNGRSVDFDRPLYSAFVWGAIILFFIGMKLFSIWKFDKLSDISSVAIWLLPLTYIISLSSAASSYLAWNHVWIQMLYASIFLLGYYLTQNKVGITLLKNAFIASAYFIVIFGLCNWFGNKEGIYTLVKWFSVNSSTLNFYRDAVMSDANGARLTSVFQYANSYAAFLIAVLLCSLYLIVVSTRWFSITIHAFMAVPIIISFFLTLSRGGLVILPVVLLVVLPFLKPTRQILYLIQTVIAFALSLIILNKITNIGIELAQKYVSSLSISGWITLLSVSLINAVLATAIQKWIFPWLEHKGSKLNMIRWANIVLPAGAIVIGGLAALLLLNDSGMTKLLPDNVRTRIENINFQQHSVLERGTFYKDAIKLVKDYPLFGAGGGAWASLYEKYQNNPYTSREAHNFFLQYLVEVGILGFIVFLLFIAFIFYVFIRNYIKQSDETRPQRFIFYILVVSLLIHSMIDFDLSYVYLGFLLFLSLGIMISGDSIPVSAKLSITNSRYRWVYPSIVTILSIIFFFNSTQLLSASGMYLQSRAAAESGQDFDDIMAVLDKAIEIQDVNPHYNALKLDILMQVYSQTSDDAYYSEAQKLVERITAKEPHNRQLIERHIAIYTAKGQTDKALEIVNREISNFPWDITLYENKIRMNVELGNKARLENDSEQRDRHWNDALATYEQVIDRMKMLEQLPEGQLQGREFKVTAGMRQSLGQMEYIRGNYDAAENFLKTLATPEQLNDPTGRIIIRWYLAALKKQGKDDQDLYDKLIAADPNEETQIEGLLNAKF